MDAIEYLKEVDPWLVFFVVISIVLAGKFIYKTFIEDIIQKYGWETEKMRKHREDHEKIDILMELTKKNAENLEKLQERHSKDEEEFRQNLNNYMEESRKDRKALHDEMSKFTSNRVSDRQQSLQIQKELKESIQGLISGQNDRDRKIETLTSLFVDKEIEDLRWTILDFTASLSDGKKYNRESFDHIMRMYNKYEKILEENNMENGLVEESIKFVQEKYHEKLETGFN